MKNKKTVIITGGNSGLGFECARNIVKDTNYHVILACRDIVKAEVAKDELIKESGNPNIDTMEVNVSSLASVRMFVDAYKKKYGSKVYGIVCNAGVNGTNIGNTVDGFDVIFETNHLGHFLLTNLMLPILIPSGRIAVVSSDMHCPPGEPIVWPGTMALAHPDEDLKGNFARYSLSKLCNLYFTYELAKRLVSIGSKITINALNPGLMTDTNFAPDKSRFTQSFMDLVSDRIGSLKESAVTLGNMVTDSSLADTTGKYFDRAFGIVNSSPLSYNEDNALELWNKSVKLANLSKDETLPLLL